MFHDSTKTTAVLGEEDEFYEQIYLVWQAEVISQVSFIPPWIAKDLRCRSTFARSVHASEVVVTSEQDILF
jgi:hypothetical protein